MHVWCLCGGPYWPWSPIQYTLRAVEAWSMAENWMGKVVHIDANTLLSPGPSGPSRGCLTRAVGSGVGAVGVGVWGCDKQDKTLQYYLTKEKRGLVVVIISGQIPPNDHPSKSGPFLCTVVLLLFLILMLQFPLLEQFHPMGTHQASVCALTVKPIQLPVNCPKLKIIIVQ